MHLTPPLRRGLAGAAAASLTLTGLVSLAPMAQAAGTTLVINEVYGGGGNSGATYTHDFVELFNGTDAEIDLAGYVLSYYSAAGNLGNACELTGTIAPGDHFLVQQGAGNGGTTPLPGPDAECSAFMSASSGSVTLEMDTGERVDTVGYGSGATIREGNPAPGLSNTTSASRTDGIDTDDNAADFTRGEPTPQNASGGALGDHVVINEFYGRGGSANQPYTHKFVELYNPTGAAVDLAGTSLQYRSATGTGLANGSATLAGSIAAGGYYLIQLPNNGGTGEALPTPDHSTTSVNPSGTTGTIFLAEGTERINPDDTDLVIDKLGYGGSNSPEVEAAPYPGGNSTPGSLNRSDFVDTDNNLDDFTFSETVTPQNSGGDGGDPDPDPEPVEVSIAEIQGTGDATPLNGQEVVTEGVVTAAYPTGGFRGVYIQTPGTGGTPKAPGDASDGIFVFSDWAADNLAIGDCVSVEGTAGEYNGLTQLSQAFATVLDGCEPVTPTPLATLPVTDAEKEVYEGMLVHPEGTYTITNNYQLNQYGQLGLAVGDEPLYQATEVVRPGPEAEAYEAANRAKYITLDDGSSWNYMSSNMDARYSPLPYLSHEEPHRTGSQVTFAQPVILDYRFQWNYQPTGQVVGSDSTSDPISSENDREYAVPEVGGNIQIGAFNVLNYFTDLGRDEEDCDSFTDMYGNPVATDYCEVRGAWSESAFEDQQAKLVAAINGTDADVLALMEIEANSALSYKDLPRDAALAALVDALNEDLGTERWGYAQSPVALPPNEDIIRTAFIYDRSSVQVLGRSEILLDEAFANARYPLAQKFKARGTGQPFVAVSNHFKSKGSGEDDGTGQGLANPSREAQARALTAWTEDRFADESVFLMGDFNAYSMETPIQIMENAGYTNTAKVFEPDSASYQYQGRLGSLDHVLANDKAMRLVTGAAVWDINGDEAIAFQYSRRNYNITDFHVDDQFASSDHDPIMVGLDTGNRGRGNGR